MGFKLFCWLSFAVYSAFGVLFVLFRLTLLVLRTVCGCDVARGVLAINRSFVIHLFLL